MATPEQIRRRGRFSLILGTFIAALALGAVAYADQVFADNDLATNGNQSTLNLPTSGTIAPGDTVNTTAQLVVRWQGGNHLAPGDQVKLVVDAANTTLPAGYSVSSVTTTVPGPADPAWNGNGDEVAGTSNISFTAPAADASYTVAYMIDTGSPTAACASATPKCVSGSPSYTVNVDVTQPPPPPPNVDPTADAGGDVSGDEGSPIGLDGSGSSDSDGTIDTYAWSYSIDSADPGATCDFDDATSATPNITCTDDGTYTATLEVTDDDGAKDSDSATVTVSNANPTATKSFDSSIDEGSNFSLALTGGSDPGTNDTLSYQFDCGDGSGYGAAGTTASTSCPTTDDGTRSVKAKILDDNGGYTEYTDNVTVNNVPPDVTLTGAVSALEGDVTSYTFSWTDPGADTWTRLVTCGDHGALSNSAFDETAKSGSFDCKWLDNYNGEVVSVTVDDDDGGTDSDSKTVDIGNALPNITSASFGGSSVSCGASNATLVVSFTDPGTADTWDADIDWDNDGNYDQTVNNVASPFSVPHTYGSAGVHTAKVKVTDDDGGASNTPTANVTVNFNLSSILQPVNDTRNGQQPSMFKYGSTVPVKVEITDCDGSHPSGLDVRVFFKKTSSAPPPAGTDEAIATNSPDNGNQMRFSSPIYIFNFGTKYIDDPSSTVRIDVVIPATNQLVYAFIGLKSK